MTVCIGCQRETAAKYYASDGIGPLCLVCFAGLYPIPCCLLSLIRAELASHHHQSATKPT